MTGMALANSQLRDKIRCNAANFFQQYRGQQKRIQGLDQDQVLLRAGSNPAAIHCAPETTIPARH